MTMANKPETEPVLSGGAVRATATDQPQDQAAKQRDIAKDDARRTEMRATAEKAKQRADESKEAANKAEEEARKARALATQHAEEAAKALAASDPEQAFYVVAEGKSLFTKSGTLGAFQQIKARDFANGQAELDEHVRGGNVVLRT